MITPVSDPTDHPRHPFVAWLINYSKGNPLKVLSGTAFTFGSLLLASFFWDIGELPQLDMPSLSPLVITIAAGGLALILSLVAPPMAGWLLARSSSDAPSWQSDLWSVLIYVAPGIGFSSLLWASSNRADFWESGSKFAGFLLIFSGALLAVLRVWTLRGSIPAWPARICAWATLAGYSILQTVLMACLVSTSVVIVGSQSQAVEGQNASIVLWTLYACGLGALAIRVKSLEVIRIILAVGFLVAIVLMIGTGEMTSISKVLLNKVGWGNYPAKMFVTDRGCALLNRNSAHVVCKIEKAEGGNLVCPVMVRSRVGTPNYLAISPFTSSGNWPNRENAFRVSIPREDVIALDRISALKKSEQPMGSRDTQNPATRLVSPGGAQEKWLTDQCGPISGPSSVAIGP